MLAAAYTWVVASVLAAAYLVFGPVGLFATASVAAGITVAAVRLRMPPPAPTPVAPPADPRPNQAFLSYLRIDEALAQAGRSRWHYDQHTRPLLARMVASLLAERRQLDAADGGQAVRGAVGEDLWPLLDPDAGSAIDSHQPGVDPATLRRIVDRLEKL